MWVIRIVIFVYKGVFCLVLGVDLRGVDIFSPLSVWAKNFVNLELFNLFQGFHDCQLFYSRDLNNEQLFHYSTHILELKIFFNFFINYFFIQIHILELNIKQFFVQTLT